MKIQRPFHQDFRDMLLISKRERTIGKPFVPEDCSDLIQFGKRDVIPENVINTIMNISDVFNLQYEIFRYSRIATSCQWTLQLRKINSLFQASNTKGRSKSTVQNENIKLHIRLLPQMHLSTRRHSGDRDDFLPRNINTFTCIVEKR